MASPRDQISTAPRRPESPVRAQAKKRRPALARGRSPLVRWTLATTDCLALVLAFVVAEVLFSPPDRGGPADAVSPTTEVLLFLATLPAWLLVARVFGLYDRDQQRTDHSTTDDLGNIVNLVTIGTWLFLATSWLLRLASPSFPKLLTFWALAIVAIAFGRTAGRAYCRSCPAYLQRAVVVGAGDVGQLVASKFLHHPEYGVEVVGFVDASPKELRAELQHVPLLGKPDSLPAIIEQQRMDRAIFAFWPGSHGEMLDLSRQLNALGVQVDIVPRLFEVINKGADVHAVESVPLIGLPPVRLSPSAQRLKRALDVSVALAGLILLAPFFMLIGLLIKLDSGGPVFFRQMRVGLGNSAFRMYKFRTMTAEAERQKGALASLNVHATSGGDPRMFKVIDDPRVTRAGRLLRRHLLDEFPQLINVLKGEMSLVGPRPLILDEDQHVGGWARRRLDLKPGMTGLWQVLGRSKIPFEEMVQIDYRYVTNWSLWLDIRLLLRTLPLMLKGARGAY